MCDRCIKQEVCSKYAATGGHMISCVHFIGRSAPRDENGCIAAPRLPMVTDEIAVVLTREQWQAVQIRMEFAVADDRAKAYWWANCCASREMGEENSRLHTAQAEASAAILEKIVAALDWPEPPKEE